jgi:DNA-directed RNA polymerase specialized sigma24 family protein
MPGMMPDEVLAVCRLRQWAKDRAAMRSGQVTDYRRQGWRERRTRECDARIVRVVDFERALSRLTEEHQAILLLTYREHRDQRQVSDATGVSVRALSYKLPAARQALASILDRLDLL